jgi:hypothetical protein
MDLLDCISKSVAPFYASNARIFRIRHAKNTTSTFFRRVVNRSRASELKEHSRQCAVTMRSNVQYILAAGESNEMG